MPNSPDLDMVYDKYFDMLYRICFVYFSGNAHDSEDAVQTVFLKYIASPSAPKGGEQLKAWLIVTAQNTCKSMLRRHFRKDSPLDSAETEHSDFEYGDTLRAVMSLPYEQKTAVLLCFYAGYTAKEAAEMMGCRENTVYSYIHRAKKKLKKQLGV